jgi:hypothetical protein
MLRSTATKHLGLQSNSWKQVCRSLRSRDPSPSAQDDIIESIFQPQYVMLSDSEASQITKQFYAIGDASLPTVAQNDIQMIIRTHQRKPS